MFIIITTSQMNKETVLTESQEDIPFKINTFALACAIERSMDMEPVLGLSMNSSVVKVKDVFSSQVCCFSSSAGTCGESSSYLRSVLYNHRFVQMIVQIVGQLTLLGLC